MISPIFQKCCSFINLWPTKKQDLYDSYIEYTNTALMCLSSTSMPYYIRKSDYYSFALIVIDALLAGTTVDFTKAATLSGDRRATAES